MRSVRDPLWYREQAARYRELGVATTDSAQLRDSYLALSFEYERLAKILEQSALLDGPAGKSGIYSQHGRKVRS
jgi:hypothetical protein